MIVTGCEGGRLVPPPQPMWRQSKNAQFRTPIIFFFMILPREDVETSIREPLDWTATHAVRLGFISPPSRLLAARLSYAEGLWLTPARASMFPQ